LLTVIEQTILDSLDIFYRRKNVRLGVNETLLAQHFYTLTIAYRGAA